MANADNCMPPICSVDIRCQQLSSPEYVTNINRIMVFVLILYNLIWYYLIVSKVPAYYLVLSYPLYSFTQCVNSGIIVILRSNPSVCPRRRRRHVRTSKNTMFCGTKCTCAWSWLSYCNAQLSYLCVECYNNNIIINIMNNIIIITIIKPLLKIFNECRSLTVVGKLNPYWKSSMNVEVWRGWEN